MPHPLGCQVARLIVKLCLLIVAVSLPGCASQPSHSPGLLGNVAGSGDSTLEAQLRAITDDPTPPETRRVIFIGAALHSREDVFDRDVALMDDTLRPLYGTAYRSVKLSNVRLYAGDRTLPLATIEHLDQVFDTLAEHQRRNDRYIVLLSTHGVPGMLELEQPARYRPPWRLLGKEKIADWAGQLEPRPTWLVISACYAGSHLKQALPEHLIAMTAAAADRTSFGCSNTEHNSWFITALVSALRAHEPAGSASFDEVWRQTLALIARREKEQGNAASMPDWYVGNKMGWRFHGPIADF